MAKLTEMFGKVVGPSPLSYTLKKIRSLRGGESVPLDPDIDVSDAIPVSSKKDQFMSGDDFIESLEMEFKPDNPNSPPKRMTPQQVRDFYSSKGKLSNDQRLIRSILEDCQAHSASKDVFDSNFENLREMYNFRRRYRRYLRLKTALPLGCISSFTRSELLKMSYASALGSKSISMTMNGFIGCSLPAFFFFHMAGYYLPDVAKPGCYICKYLLGAPVWILCSLTDGCLGYMEERVFGESVPIDITNTGGTIPSEIGDIDSLRRSLDSMKAVAGKKTYLGELPSEIKDPQSSLGDTLEEMKSWVTEEAKNSLLGEAEK